MRHIYLQGDSVTEDLVLVQAYVQDGSQQAFTELVSRYINLVYSVAFRRIGDSHLAEDITQATFIILARKAGTFSDRTIVSSWLCRTAGYVASNALVGLNRQRKLEQQVPMRSVSNDCATDIWMQVASSIDPALSQLGKKDHEAIVLRFFEGKTLKQVASLQGTSEDAARMRINRALDKLKTFLVKHGVSLSTPLIAKALSTNAVQAAPAGLAPLMATTGLNASGHSLATLNLVNGALKLMAVAKMKIGLAAIIIVSLTIGTAAFVSFAQSTPAHADPRCAETSTELKSKVLKSLETQKSALKNVYFDYTATAVPERGNARMTYSAYFDGGRFYLRTKAAGKTDADREQSLDGQTLWDGSHDRIHRTPLADAASVFQFRVLEWPYLDAASIDAPAFVAELAEFHSLEPMAIHELMHNETAKIEEIGENFRLTFDTSDVQIAAIQKVDLNQYQRQLAKTPNTKKWIDQEIESVKRFKEMKPVRKITMLLDARYGFGATEREEWTADGERIRRIVAENWKYYSSVGIWLPSRCVVSYFTQPYALKDFSKEPIQTVTLELQQVEFGKRDIRFNLDRPATGLRPK